MEKIPTFEEFVHYKYGIDSIEFNLMYSSMAKDAIRHLYDTKYKPDDVITYVTIASKEDEDISDVIYVGKDKDRAYSIRPTNSSDTLTVEVWKNGQFIEQSSW